MNIQLVDRAKEAVKRIAEDSTADTDQIRAALEEIEMDVVARLEALEDDLSFDLDDEDDDYDETLLVDDDD